MKIYSNTVIQIKSPLNGLDVFKWNEREISCFNMASTFNAILVSERSCPSLRTFSIQMKIYWKEEIISFSWLGGWIRFISTLLEPWTWFGCGGLPVKCWETIIDWMQWSFVRVIEFWWARICCSRHRLPPWWFGRTLDWWPCFAPVLLSADRLKKWTEDWVIAGHFAQQAAHLREFSFLSRFPSLKHRHCGSLKVLTRTGGFGSITIFWGRLINPQDRALEPWR